MKNVLLKSKILISIENRQTSGDRISGDRVMTQKNLLSRVILRKSDRG